MSDQQRGKLLKDIHHALIGDPLNPDKPGLVAMVGRHELTLYGKNGKNGLQGEAFKVKRLIWMGGGFVVAVQVLVVAFELYREFGR